MKKSFVTTLLLTAVMAITTNLTANAVDTQIKQDSSDQTGTMAVAYNVAPGYTVTIPQGVTLGNTEISKTVSAEDVCVKKGQKVVIKLTDATPTAEDEIFKVKTSENAEVEYNISKNSDSAKLKTNDVVLEVNPANGSSGSATLRFSAPQNVTYAGEYTGNIIFTISVEDV